MMNVVNNSEYQQSREYPSAKEGVLLSARKRQHARKHSTDAPGIRLRSKDQTPNFFTVGTDFAAHSIGVPFFECFLRYEFKKHFSDFFFAT